MGRRHSGQQPVSLKQGIHQIMRNFDITTVEAQDKDLWRNIQWKEKFFMFWLKKNLYSEENAL